jgi:hypothetical protein
MRNSLVAMFILVCELFSKIHGSTPTAYGVCNDISEVTEISNSNVFYKIPAKYTFDNSDKVVIGTSKNSESLSIYDDNFNLIKLIGIADTESTDDNCYVMNLYYSSDYSRGAVIGNGMLITTQTLFNQDEKYEYIVSYDGIVNGISELVGFKVKSEDGTTICIVPFPDGFLLCSRAANDIHLLEINDKKFLILNTLKVLTSAKDEEKEDGTYITYTDTDKKYYYYNLIYEIDDKNTSVRSVSPPIKVYASPTISYHESMVDIDLSHEITHDATFSVSAISGRVVENGRINASTGKTSIDTSTMQRGVYIVSVNNGATPRESAKIIVR